MGPRNPAELPSKSTGEYDPKEAEPRPIPKGEVCSPEHVGYNLALKQFSLAQLIHFYHKFEEQGRINETTTARQVMQDIVLPETAKDVCRYVDIMLTGAPKMADAMLCHWWGTSFRDVVLGAAEYASGLLSRSELEAKTFGGGLGQTALHTTFWLHLLSANHHAKHTPGQILCETDKVSQLVRHAGALVVALDPELVTLTRARCLYEVFEAAQAKRPVHFCGRLAPKFKDGIAATRVKAVQDCETTNPKYQEWLLDNIQNKALLGQFNRQVAEVVSIGVCKLALGHAMADTADSVDLVQLFRNGGDPNVALTRRGERALTLSLQRGRTAHVAALLDARADPNVACTGGWTALHSAVQLGLRQLAEALLAAGADANAAAYTGRTPLMEAAERKNAELVRMLTAGGGDPALRDTAGCSVAELLAR